MDNRTTQDPTFAPRAESWLVAGMASTAVGLWLLEHEDPFLLTLWGIGLSIVGLAAVILGLGLLLRIWR